MIKAVLFDIDGTLVDSNAFHVDAWHRVFSEAGHPIQQAAIRQQIGKGGDNLVPALLPNLSSGEQQALADGHGQLFKQLYLQRVQPFPAARDLLRRVHGDGVRVVLASSASKEELRYYERLLGIEDVVAATTSIDDVETSKPAPDIFAVALEKAGISPAQAVVVGDTPYDVAAAGRAGMGTVAVLSGGFSRAELGAADMIYDDIADLLARYEGSPLAR